MCHLCLMTRRRALRGFAAAATAALGSASWGAKAAGPAPRASGIANLAVVAAAAGVTVQAGAAADPVILGEGKYRYQVLENWGALPPGYTYRDGAAVCVDSKDNVYVFNRGAHPVIVFDRSGNFLRSWGEDIGFVNAHGAAVGPDDMLYLTDDFGDAVRKCTSDGKVVLTIGTPKKPAPAFSGDPFNRCTHSRLVAAGRHLCFRRLCQRPRSQVRTGRQAAVLVGRTRNRPRRVQPGPQYRLRRRGLGLCRRPGKPPRAGVRQQRQV